MRRHRIAVGLDAGEPARRALWWAVREAARTGASLLVVTAWPARQRDAARRTGQLFAARVRLQRMQVERIAEAVAGLDRPPLVARQLVLAEPVPALCHAARFADIVVLGGRIRAGVVPRVVVPVPVRADDDRYDISTTSTTTKVGIGAGRSRIPHKKVPGRSGSIFQTDPATHTATSRSPSRPRLSNHHR